MKARLWVYALYDPREPCRMRYIGVTVNPRKRLNAHLCDTQPLVKVAWIQRVQADGFQPRMTILQRVDVGLGLVAERQWIRKLYEHGLTNDGIPFEHRTNSAAKPAPFTPKWMRQRPARVRVEAAAKAHKAASASPLVVLDDQTLLKLVAAEAEWRKKVDALDQSERKSCELQCLKVD